MTSDHTISAIGFCTPTGDGNFSTLEGAIRNIVELGSEAVELSLYGEEIISGGRLIPHRVDHLVNITRQFDTRYSVHGQIVSNFMDREHLEYQRLLFERCSNFATVSGRKFWFIILAMLQCQRFLVFLTSTRWNETRSPN